jgi:hypothetical protein
VFTCFKTFIEFGLLSLLLVLRSREEHNRSLEDIVEGPLIFILKDDFSELGFYHFDVIDKYLKVVVALLLVDEIEERYLEQKMLFLYL